MDMRFRIDRNSRYYKQLRMKWRMKWKLGLYWGWHRLGLPIIRAPATVKGRGYQRHPYPWKLSHTGSSTYLTDRSMKLECTFKNHEIPSTYAESPCESLIGWIQAFLGSPCNVCWHFSKTRASAELAICHSDMLHGLALQGPRKRTARTFWHAGETRHVRRHYIRQCHILPDVLLLSMQNTKAVGTNPSAISEAKFLTSVTFPAACPSRFLHSACRAMLLLFHYEFLVAQTDVTETAV